MKVLPEHIKPLFSAADLAARLQTLGAEISRDYGNEQVVAVGILNGAFMFFADLIRQITSPTTVEFMGVASYAGTASTGVVRVTYDLQRDIRGKHVLLVEDIVDTGRTLHFLQNMLQLRQPKTLKICTLLCKPEALEVPLKVDYCGFNITREFVVGYGLDLDGAYRQLPFIGQVQQNPGKPS